MNLSYLQYYCVVVLCDILAKQFVNRKSNFLL